MNGWRCCGHEFHYCRLYKKKVQSGHRSLLQTAFEASPSTTVMNENNGLFIHPLLSFKKASAICMGQVTLSLLQKRFNQFLFCSVKHLLCCSIKLFKSDVSDQKPFSPSLLWRWLGQICTALFQNPCANKWGWEWEFMPTVRNEKYLILCVQVLFKINICIQIFHGLWNVWLAKKQKELTWEYSMHGLGVRKN